MLRKFDQAISVLMRLMTKPAARYANSIHSSNDLENVEGFIRAVADKVRKAKNAGATHGETPLPHRPHQTPPN